MKRIVELDGVRTIAVGMVICTHFAPVPTFFDHFFAYNGGLGVDIFFVLSGFLITTILLAAKGTEHPYKVFYARRFLRIMPPYLLLLAIVYGLTLAFHEPLQMKKLVGQLLFLSSFNAVPENLHHLVAVLHNPQLIPSPLAITPHHPVGADYPMLPIAGSLGPTWSLSVEEWFYVLWAPVVLLLRRSWIVAVAFALCFTGFLLRWFIDPTGILQHGDILLAGALLAVWIEHRRTLPQSTQARYDQLLNATTILAWMVFITLTTINRRLTNLTFAEIAFAGTLAWLVRNANADNVVSTFLRWRPLVWVGSISYSLYLIHLPIYFLVRKAVTDVAPAISQDARYWVVSLTSVVLALVFSALSWRLMEAPILSRKDELTDWIKHRNKAERTTA